jgi:hypothetical protein
MSKLKLFLLVVLFVFIMLATGSMPTTTKVDLIATSAMWIFFGITATVEFMVYHKKLTYADPVYESARLLADAVGPGLVFILFTVTKQSVGWGVISFIWLLTWLYEFKKNIQSFKPQPKQDV